MERRIILPKGGIQKLSKDFGFSRITIWSALTYKTHSSKAKMIRKAALERGGLEIGTPKEASHEEDNK